MRPTKRESGGSVQRETVLAIQVSDGLPMRFGYFGEYDAQKGTTEIVCRLPACYKGCQLSRSRHEALVAACYCLVTAVMLPSLTIWRVASGMTVHSAAN